jgi:hypothetical protein
MLAVAGCEQAAPTQVGKPVGKATPTATPAPFRAPLRADPNVAKPSELTSWPWPKIKPDTPHRGVTHWLANLKDGTTLDLMRFDFAVNPGLRFELYSQDQDDDKPWDNVVRWWEMGVGPAIKHLNGMKGGPVVAAWNGPFFGYYHQKMPGRAFHLAPVVINGQIHHNRANHRWTLGWKNFLAGPQFQTIHMAGRAALQPFDFASGTVQNLIKDGQLLKIHAFPRAGEAFPKPPVPSTPSEIGHVPFFDHAKFSRASIAWSKNQKQLWMILVREPKSDNEGHSIQNLVDGVPQSAGWNVPDLQRFWKSLMDQGLIWNAINSDAGDVGQLSYQLPDGNYNLIPARNASPFERKVFTPQFSGAPAGGALMYFLVRDRKAKQ